jgi:hypothetical protein
VLKSPTVHVNYVIIDLLSPVYGTSCHTGATVYRVILTVTLPFALSANVDQLITSFTPWSSEQRQQFPFQFQVVLLYIIYE